MISGASSSGDLRSPWGGGRNNGDRARAPLRFDAIVVMSAYVSMFSLLSRMCVCEYVLPAAAHRNREAPMWAAGLLASRDACGGESSLGLCAFGFLLPRSGEFVTLGVSVLGGVVGWVGGWVVVLLQTLRA